MGFLLKPLLVVAKVFVGLTIAVIGAATGNPALIALGAGIVISTVVGVFKKKAITGNALANQRLNKSVDPEAFRKIVFGVTAMPLDLRYWEDHGTDNVKFDEVIVVAGHEIESFENFTLEDAQHGFDGSGNSSILGTAFKRFTRTVGVTGTTLSAGAGTIWTNTSSLTGMAFMVLKYVRSEEKWPRGFPNKMTQVGKGALMYDPRLDSTLPGGSGAHRIDDQTTWQYNDGTTDIGRNPALQMLWYLIGWRVLGTLVCGMGVPTNAINLAEFMQAANDAEAQGFKSDCALSTGDEHKTNIGIIESTCGGRLLDPGGLYTFKIAIDDTANIAVAFDDNDVMGPIQWFPAQPMVDQKNVFTGVYVEPNDQYQLRPFPAVKDDAFIASDGFERRANNRFVAVQDPLQAQKLSRILLNQTRFQGVFKAAFSYKALLAKNWDVVTLTLAVQGWTNELFRIIQHDITTDGIIVLTLEQTDPQIYVAGTVTPVVRGQGNAGDPRVKIPVLGLGAAPIVISGAGVAAQDGLRITFTAPTGMVKMTIIQYRVSGDTDFIFVGTLTGAENSLDLTPLSPSTTYDVRARHISIVDVPGDFVTAAGTTGNATILDFDNVGGANVPEDGSTATDNEAVIFGSNNNLFANGQAKLIAADGRPAGMRATEGGTDPFIVEQAFDENGDSVLRIVSDTDDSITVSFAAFKVNPKSKYRVQYEFRVQDNAGATGNASSGFFARFYGHNALPSGIRFIGRGVIEASGDIVTDNGRIDGFSNVAATTTFQTHDFTITPTSTWDAMSLNFANWVGLGLRALEIRDLRITEITPPDLAALDSAADTSINNLIKGTPPGIHKGGFGNLRFEKNISNGGAANRGEVRVLGTTFYHPDGTTRTLVNDKHVATNFEGTVGTGDKGVFYIIFTDVSPDIRFPGHGLDSTPDFFAAQYNWSTDAWNAVNNGSVTFAFTPLATDCLVAIGFRNDTDTQITTVDSLLGVNIDLPADGATRQFNRGEYVDATVYSLGDVVQVNGSSFEYISNTPASGNIPPNTAFWALLVQAGNFKDRIFIASDTMPATPTGNSPAGWQDNFPIGTTWQSEATKTFEGVLVGDWTTPTLFKGSFQGPWSSVKNYNDGDSVTHDGRSFVLTVPTSLNNVPPTSNTSNAFWDLLAAKGDPGDPSTAFNTSATHSNGTVLNMRSLANGLGYDGVGDATFTVTVSANIFAASGTNDAIDTGSWPSGPTIALTLVVNTAITIRAGGGKGGNGGGGFSNGSPGLSGGDGINLEEDLTIILNGTSKVSGGSGGGGGGGGFFNFSPEIDNGGGGGGGGFPNGVGGFGAFGASSSGANGGNGTTTSGGTGGVAINDGGDGGGVSGITPFNGNAGDNSPSQSGGSGGTKGDGIKRNGHVATVSGTGTHSGLGT